MINWREGYSCQHIMNLNFWCNDIYLHIGGSLSHWTFYVYRVLQLKLISNIESTISDFLGLCTDLYSYLLQSFKPIVASFVAFFTICFGFHNQVNKAIER